MNKRILFICTNNAARSRMAEAYLRAPWDMITTWIEEWFGRVVPR